MGEKFAANPVTGTGSISVPLATSPGRSGFGPKLALSYDSGSGNGPFGFGWSLALPAIARKTDQGLPQYRDFDESDVYLLSGAEDLVPVLQADGSRFVDDRSAAGYIVHRYRPRVEGPFARIERWIRIASGDIHWRSISRDNVTTLYGQDDNSRILDPAGPSSTRPARIFSWLICASYDDRGNAIVYEYAAEDDRKVVRGQANERNRVRTANRYLKRIKYGNRTPNRDVDSWQAVDPATLADETWMFEVVFDYDEGHCQEVDLEPETPQAFKHEYVLASSLPGDAWAVRPDPFSTHRAGFEVRTYRRCHRVLMFHHIPDLPTGEKGYDGLVRSTEFDYADFEVAETFAIDAELAHQGSTRFASFIRRVTQSGHVRDDEQTEVVRNGIRYATYLRRSLPPLEFEYSKARIADEVQTLDASSLENLPLGIDGLMFHWVDLDGEGLSGILTEQAETWFFKRNLGGGRFGPLQTVAEKPSLARLGSGGQQLLDLAGDGQLDLVSFSGPTPGFFERSADDDWEPFRSFRALPNIPWDEPNLRFVDLDGDGHADVLITEGDVVTWHSSLAEDGFGPAQRVHVPWDEELGPRLVFADGTQSIHLADMCGDGLTDLVRIRNGEVCYWPNLGYGRFGPKVTMDNAPWFDHPHQFDQRHLRLADIDGSGTNDIIYLAGDGARVYFNQCGNRWSEARRLTRFPRVDNTASVMTADLLGNGTACLVWSSPLPAESRQPLRYIDLMGGIKPHLLIRSINNLGAETQVDYAPSTRFYLDDRRDGRPWLTRLPFPVHVVERVVTHDRISGNLFASHYAYHHGYFDGIEREFRGFGLVEQWDTEEFAALHADGRQPTATNIEASSHVPPVLTRTWFHTGLYLGRQHVSDFFAGLLDAHDGGEYYREPGLNDSQVRALLLDDTVLPDGLSVDEEREACRALKGAMLRQEVYALDGTDKQPHPYSVAEQNFTIRLLQPRAGNRHAVFLTHAREAISTHYERQSADPRVGQALTLQVDDFGNILHAVAVGYGRRQPDMALSLQDRVKQAQIHITCTESSFTNPIEEPDHHRTPLPCESRSYELTGFAPAEGRSRFRFEDMLEAVASVQSLDYESSPTPGWRQKRLVEHLRTRYRPDDLGAARGDPLALLALGVVERLALPGESTMLAFTAGLVAQAFGGRVNDAMLDNDGRYVHGEDDAHWWLPSGRLFYSPDTTEAPVEELNVARQHFFLPRRYRDPFHTDATDTESVVTYDRYDLLVQETHDPLGNRVTAGKRNVDPARPPDRLRHDYRVLQPALVMDPNRNRSEVVFDALGMVVGTAVMGKPEDDPVPGDRITAAFRADLTPDEIDRCVDDPKGPLATVLLDHAGTRIVHDLTAYWRERDSTRKPPAVVVTLARETHASEPAPEGGVRILASLSYSDGFGREIQKKIQAEPGPVPLRDEATDKVLVGADGRLQMTAHDVDPRWVGSGWTVFNNKGKPVRQYEPFFTDRHRFEFDLRIGVSPVLFYDPVERVVATLHPNHTWDKVVFDAWRQATWDVNDTVLVTDPRTDADAGHLFGRLEEDEVLPTWHALRTSPALADAREERWPERVMRDAETRAAHQAAVHAATPTVAHADSLGRTVLTVAHNRFKPSDAPLADPPVEEFHRTGVVLDIEGNQREVIDALGRVVMRYDYDMLGNRIRQLSMDAGERWMLNDVAGKPLRAWDSREHVLRTTYDPLRRPTQLFVRRGNGVEALIERTVYGEGHAEAVALNLRGRVYQRLDQAGVVTHAGRNPVTDRDEGFDFKGNPLRSSRQLAVDYRHTLDWSDEVALDEQVFASSTTYDALDRPLSVTTPDGSVIRPSFNEANLLDAVRANLRGAQEPTEFVTNIDYDAKGQREAIHYRNGVTTTYAHDEQTLRLIHLQTLRGETALQDLRFVYDPAGNITHIQDDADIQNTVYFRNQRVEPSADYVYDAVYRLIGASGREHLGQLGDHLAPPAQVTHSDAFRQGPHPGDGNSMGNYSEGYDYDAVGNILRMRHRTASGGWTRRYAYAGDSNRLLATSLPGDDPPGPYSARYEHDAHGNMIVMPHLPVMEWDFKDQLHVTQQQVVNDGVGERTYYVYDAAGQRVRKVTESAAQDGDVPRKKDERIYLGGFEVYRKYNGAGDVVTLERETLHVMDDKQRIALVETRTQGDDGSPEELVRNQLGNHLGSATLELDDQARIVSYEEYYSYGSTSYMSVRRDVQLNPKRYRYTAMERDEETALSYHAARYYAPWLGRWLSADPEQVALPRWSPYCYGFATPLRFRDWTGREPQPTERQVQLHAQVEQQSASLGDIQTNLQASRDALAREMATGDYEFAKRELRSFEWVPEGMLSSEERAARTEARDLVTRVEREQSNVSHWESQASRAVRQGSRLARRFEQATSTTPRPSLWDRVRRRPPTVQPPEEREALAELSASHREVPAMTVERTQWRDALQTLRQRVQSLRALLQTSRLTTRGPVGGAGFFPEPRRGPGGPTVRARGTGGINAPRATGIANAALIVLPIAVEGPRAAEEVAFGVIVCGAHPILTIACGGATIMSSAWDMWNPEDVMQSYSDPSYGDFYQ